MCEEADYYYRVQESRERKARKEHVCCACKETIQPGHKYVASFAVGEGPYDPEAYKHCLRCWAMLDAIIQARRGENVAIAWELDCGEDWHDTIGDLPEDVATLAFLSADEAQQRLGQKLVHKVATTP